MYERAKSRWFKHFNFIIICAIPVHKNILKRKMYQELWESIKNVSILVIGLMLYLYFDQQAYFFSRSVFTRFWIFASIFIWLEWSLYKVFVRKQIVKRGNLPRMLLKRVMDINSKSINSAPCTLTRINARQS